MVTTSPPVLSAIYARISSDDEGRGLGVARQIKDCIALAERKGWTVAHTYRDNDVSATRAKVRPDFQRMLADVRAGRINGIVVYDVDRLTRTPRELEDLIDLADKTGLALASAGGEIDLATPQGRMTARIKASVARHETDQQSRRLKDKFDQRAQTGAPHGLVAFGYRRVPVFDERGRQVGSRDELHEPQADLIREAARRLLRGESLRSVTAWFNESGQPTPRGGRWSSTLVRQVMLRDRNAGRRIHRGKDIGPAAWPPVYADDSTHARVKELLTAPDRRTNRGSTRKHLLTGLATCGRCHGTDIRVNSGTNRPPGYTCYDCFLRRKQADVDRVVEAVMVEWLTDPDALAELASGDRTEVDRAQAEIRACDAKLKLAADEFAESDDDDAIVVLRRIKERLGARIKTAEDTIRLNLPTAVPLEIAGPNAEANWHAAVLDVKRELIRLAWTVTIHPVPAAGRYPGAPFDPRLIEVTSKLVAR